MTIETHTNDRKALVKAIAEELGVPSTYLRAPTYGYSVGDFTVDRDGNIIGEDFTPLRDFLQRNGFLPEEPAAENTAEEELDSEEEAPADSEAEPITAMDISIPARDVNPTQMKNLVFTLYARQALINRMAQGDCLNVPAILIERLKEETPETLDDFTSLLDDAKAIAELTGFDYRDGKVTMTFPFDETQPTRWTAYANLLSRIFDSAMKAQRVFPEQVELDAQNEKYLAHVWLLRLGYHGADFKVERKILLGHLKGYCAFGDSGKMQAHKEKYTAIRRERRAAEQEAQGNDAAEVTENA